MNRASNWIHEPLSDERVSEVAERLQEAASSTHAFKSNLAAEKLREFKAKQLLRVRGRTS